MRRPEGDFVEPNWVDVTSSGPMHCKDGDSNAQREQWGPPIKDQSDWECTNANGMIPKLQEDMDRSGLHGESLVDPAIGQSGQEPHLQAWHGDEMESWLQLVDPPGSNEQGQDMWPDVSQLQAPLGPRDGAGACAAKSPPRSLPLPQPSMEGQQPTTRSSNAEAHMALGAQRAAGLIPAAGVEAFTKVRSASMPTITTSNAKWSGGCTGLGASCVTKPDAPSSQGGADKAFSQRLMPMPTTSDLPPQSSLENPFPTGMRGMPSSSWQPDSFGGITAASGQGLMPPPGRSTHMNFSHFSRPAALYSRSNMQQMGAVLAGSAGLGKEGVKGTDKSYNSNTSSVADSNCVDKQHAITRGR